MVALWLGLGLYSEKTCWDAMPSSCDNYVWYIILLSVLWQKWWGNVWWEITDLQSNPLWIARLMIMLHSVSTWLCISLLPCRKYFFFCKVILVGSRFSDVLHTQQHIWLISVNKKKVMQMWNKAMSSFRSWETSHNNYKTEESSIQWWLW